MMPQLLIAGGVGTALAASRRYYRDWGASKSECRAVLPGDELVADPADVVTRAVTIDAPAEQVWRWLVQIGQDRGGMYSYDWLENLVGLQIHSAQEIRPEWQQLAAGEQVRLVRRGWLGLRDGLALAVDRVEPGRVIVLRAEPWQAVWSFHIHPLGAERCRLISRSRSPRPHGLERLAVELIDPITLLMTRKLLLGVKARAEHRRTPTASAEHQTDATPYGPRRVD